MDHLGMVEWAAALSDLSPDEYDDAMNRFSRECKEFPSPPAVRQFAGATGMSDESRALKAWEFVIRAIRDHGCYASINFDDRLVNAVIRQLGGWVSLCDAESKQLEWIKKSFVSGYVSCSQTALGNASPLVGLAESQNGIATKPPVRIACGLPEHPIQTALEYRPREIAVRIAGPATAVAGVLVERMREAMDSKPEPAPKEDPRDPAAERAKLLAAYPAVANESGKAAS